MDVEPNEGSGVSTESVVEEVKENSWDEAEAAFDKLAEEESSEEKKEEVKESEKTSESQIEPEVVDYLKSLEGVKVPHKYKPLVEEWAKKTISELEGKKKTSDEAKQKELGDTQRAVSVFVDIFRDIAQNPEKIGDYVNQYGEHIGL